MDYKLAKKLEDAGFPQDGKGYYDDGKATMSGHNNNYEKIFHPFISEEDAELWLELNEKL